MVPAGTDQASAPYNWMKPVANIIGPLEDKNRKCTLNLKNFINSVITITGLSKEACLQVFTDPSNVTFLKRNCSGRLCDKAPAPLTGIRWISRRQLDILWEFLNSHRDLATAYNRSLQAKEYAKRKWRDIAAVLNAQGDGAYKEWQDWCKYWTDYKSKLKKRISSLRSAQSSNGGPSTEQPLTEIESKFLQILGEDFGQGLPGARVEPFTENSMSAVTSESVQIEIIEEVPIEPMPAYFARSPASSPPVSASPTPTPPAPASPALAPSEDGGVRSPRRRQRRQRREPPMSQEAARRALVESARMRAEATVRASLALENIHNTLERIERLISGVYPRADE